MTEQPTLFELRFETTAEVIRGCCGGDHEFGQCPLDAADNDNPKED